MAASLVITFGGPAAPAAETGTTNAAAADNASAAVYRPNLCLMTANNVHGGVVHAW